MDVLTLAMPIHRYLAEVVRTYRDAHHGHRPLRIELHPALEVSYRKVAGYTAVDGVRVVFTPKAHFPTLVVRETSRELVCQFF